MNNKLWRLYTQGQERMEKEFDVVKIIRSVRNVKTFVSSSLMNLQDKVSVDNGHKNVIDIDAIHEETMSSSNSDENQQKEYQVNEVDNRLIDNMKQMVKDMRQRSASR